MSKLIDAIKSNNASKALALIATGQSNPGYVDNEGETALMYTCWYHIPEIALALIATGESNPGQVNNEGDTALLLACALEIPEIALALIATGNSNPGHVSCIGDTALIWACEMKISEVALALLATGESNPEQVKKGKSALTMAKRKKLVKVVYALEHYDEFMAKHTNSVNDTSSEPHIYNIEI